MNLLFKICTFVCVSFFFFSKQPTYSILRHFWSHPFKVIWNFFTLERVIFENLSVIRPCIIYSTMCSCLFSRWSEVFFEWNLDSWPINNTLARQTIRRTIIAPRSSNMNMKRAPKCLNCQPNNRRYKGARIFAEIVEKKKSFCFESETFSHVFR